MQTLLLDAITNVITKNKRNLQNFPAFTNIDTDSISKALNLKALIEKRVPFTQKLHNRPSDFFYLIEKKMKIFPAIPMLLHLNYFLLV